MAVGPQGDVASVDRGRHGLGIEPRKATISGCRRLRSVRKATLDASLLRDAVKPRVVIDPMHVLKFLARKPGDPAAGLDLSSRSA